MEKRGNEDRGIVRDKVRGCLLGVAVGDALGAPFEHVPPGATNQAMERMGGRITDFHHCGDLAAGMWTDDTGMTLASCRAFVALEQKGGCMEPCFRGAFERWCGSDECKRPGKTVRRAASSGRADKHSWANGALMRISPVALYGFLKGLDRRSTAGLAYEAAGFTHGHPLATLPAVECALSILSVLQGEAVLPASEGLKELAPSLDEEGASSLDWYVRIRGAEIAATHPSTGLFMWRQVLERCLGLTPGRSLWADLPPFEEGILAVVNGSFDKDTAGAVGGALLGARWGERGIPERWKSRVWKGERIVSLADRWTDTVRPER